MVGTAPRRFGPPYVFVSRRGRHANGSRHFTLVYSIRAMPGQMVKFEGHPTVLYRCVGFSEELRIAHFDVAQTVPRNARTAPTRVVGPDGLEINHPPKNQQSERRSADDFLDV